MIKFQKKSWRLDYGLSEQNPLLLQELMDIGNKVLIQCNPHDKKWSNGLRMTDKDAADPSKWKGENKLGIILCAIRDSKKNNHIIIQLSQYHRLFIINDTIL